MKYYKKIDGLRCVAILFVLIEHFAGDIGCRITAGYYGVDLFFVISGFLITNILLQSKKGFAVSYKNFIGRRVLRIFPIYYLILVVLVFLGYKPCNEYIVYLASYTFNYAWIHYNIEMNALSHFWSLAVEEQFYLFWPFIVLLLRSKSKILFYSIVSLIILSFAQLSFSVFNDVTPYNFVGLFPRAGSLCMGALGAYLYNKQKLSNDFFGSIIIERMVFIVLTASLLFDYRLKFIVLAMCSLYLVLKSVHSDFSISLVNRFLNNSKVIFVGTISYGIYIYHLPIGYFITTFLIEPWWDTIDFSKLGFWSFTKDYIWLVLLPLYTIISIGIAYLSSRFIEKPILKMKDIWFP